MKGLTHHRSRFPLLCKASGDRALIYLDNAATTLKPDTVIDAVADFYRNNAGSAHRGVHDLARRSTALYEDARSKARHFFGAARDEEIVFTSGTTQALNLLAWSLGQTELSPGDEVVISGLEHHANLLPWQDACRRAKAHLRVLPLDPRGDIDLEAARTIIGARTRVLSIPHISNVLGTVTPVKTLLSLARQAGAVTIVDGAQSAGHRPLNLEQLGCDFFACSGHKMLGPTGVGVLYGRAAALERILPMHTGGAMVTEVGWQDREYAVLPHRLEAGTPPVAQAVGLAAAIDFLTEVGLDNIRSREEELTQYALQRLAELEEIQIIGDPRHRGPVISFVVRGSHPYDVAEILAHQGVALRAGTHCARPLLRDLGFEATLRVSISFYNNHDDIDSLIEALHQARAFA